MLDEEVAKVYKGKKVSKGPPLYIPTPLFPLYTGPLL